MSEHLRCIGCGVKFDHGQRSPYCPPCRVDYDQAMEAVRNKATKDDDGKPKWHLLDLSFTGAMVRILTFGAKKYAPDNWKVVDNARERYYDALMRHTNAAMDDPGSTDPEHGETHWAAVAVNAMFLWWLDTREEDR
jgi:hypothetical protein